MAPIFRSPFRRPGLLFALLLLCLVPGAAQSWSTGDASRLVGADESVTVSSGQSLYDIARAQGYALEHLAEANKLPVSLAAVSRDKVLVPGRRIVPVASPEAGLVVNLPERGFYVFRKDEEPRFFPIAIGQPGRFQTPPGRYAIREKVVNPQWIAPEWAGLGEDNVIPAGPNNPLGDRWIGLTSAGLGMHSTNNPSSIGSATSHGCMRMYPEVARTVFDLVEVGWPVTIEYQTSRVTVESDGIYVSCFPDPYHQVDSERQLKEKFQEVDLGGFFHLIDTSALLSAPSGVCSKVVDLEPRISVSGVEFPAARINGKVYLEGASLEKIGVSREFNLAEQTVKLALGDSKAEFNIRFHDAENSKEGEAFLSRGTAWFPAKEALSALSVPYKWDGPTKQIQIAQMPVEVE
jgi:L,D-transpeptidase ErfK/SrfK